MRAIQVMGISVREREGEGCIAEGEKKTKRENC